MNASGNELNYSQEDLHRLYEWGLDTFTRTLYINSSVSYPEESGVDSSMATNVSKGLRVLENIDKKSMEGNNPINIILNTDGGSVTHGMAIYDSIKSCKNFVSIQVIGNAMSMGSIILQAADCRKMSENAKFMMHYGSFYYAGNSIAASSWTETNQKDNIWMENLFLNIIKEKNSKFTRKKLKEYLNSDKIFTAEEALEFNLIDEII